MTSNEVFQLEELPKHVVIAGGGYIACEFAHIFAGLGVETCLVYRGDTVLNGFFHNVLRPRMDVVGAALAPLAIEPSRPVPPRTVTLRHLLGGLLRCTR